MRFPEGSFVKQGQQRMVTRGVTEAIFKTQRKLKRYFVKISEELIVKHRISFRKEKMRVP